MTDAEDLKTELERLLGVRVHTPEDLERIASAHAQNPAVAARLLGRDPASVALSSEPPRGVGLVALRAGIRDRDPE